MEVNDARSVDAGLLDGAPSTKVAQTNSYATQGTERTDAPLSSSRSRAMSSFLSSSTNVVLGPAELAAARGPWALFCFKVRNSRLSRTLLILCVILDCIATSLEAMNVSSLALFWGMRLPAFIGFVCLVTTGACSRGLWSTRRAYFRSWSGWLDLFFLLNITTDLVYQVGVEVGWWAYAPVAFATVSVLRNMRAWSILRICRSFRLTIIHLTRSANDLAAVCIFIVVFSLLVLVVLLHFFGFTCWYRCYPDLPLPPEVQASDSCSADSFFWDLDESQSLFCSNFISPCKGSTHCRNLFLYSVTSSCTAHERRRLQDRAWQELQTNEQAGYGAFGVQTLGAAAVALLQGFTQEGWSATMQSLANGDHRSNGAVAYITFPLMVIIGSMILMNLGIAVLWEAFDAANDVSVARPAILKESEWRVYQLLGTDWIKYLMVELSQIKDDVGDLVRSVPPVDMDDAAVDGSLFGSSFTKAISRYWYMGRDWIRRAVDIRFPEQKKRIQSAYMRARAFALRLATHRATSPVLMILVFIDTGVLFAQSGRKTGVLLSFLDLFTSTVFVVESIVLLLAFGRRGMKNGFIFLDVLIGLLAILDGLLGLVLCPTVSGCRAKSVESDGVLGTLAVISALMRPFRIFKVVKCFCPLRLTAEMVWSVHNSLIPYVMLLFYSCVVVSQLGLSFFYDPKYTSVRANDISLNMTKYFNFQSAGNAVLLFLTILTGESWHLFFKEIRHVYGEDVEDVSFDANQLSDIILSSPTRVASISTFLYFSVLFLHCLLFNLYGAILISQFIQTQKTLSVKYAAKFIVVCRNAGVPMPAEDALQGHKAQALYTHANMRTDEQRDALIKSIIVGGSFSLEMHPTSRTVKKLHCSTPVHFDQLNWPVFLFRNSKSKRVSAVPLSRIAGSDREKSAKALGEFAHKTSVVLDICKTVARKSSRMASRASSSSISLGRDRSSSNTNSVISFSSERPQKRSLISDTLFDKAAAERGIAQLFDHSTEKVAKRTKQESGSLFLNSGEDGSHIQKAERSALRISDIIANGVKLETTNKAAVKFAPDESTVILPDVCAGSRYCSAASYYTQEEELSITELCRMCWSAVKEALHQGKVFLRATAAAGLAQISPTDPDSPLLYLAYAGNLVSADCDVLSHPLASSTSDNTKTDLSPKGVNSLAELTNRAGSTVSSSFRPRNPEVDMRQQEFQHLPRHIQLAISKFRAAVEHMQKVCGITGMEWLRLFIQTASVLELIVNSSMKRKSSLWRVFGFTEIGFQIILTLDILIRVCFSKKASFFRSRSNWLDLVFQAAGWSLVTAALSLSSDKVNDLMVESVYFRFAQCTRVIRGIWILCLFKGTGMHRLVLAMQVALRRIFRLCFIFVLLVIFFVLNLRFFLQPVAGVPSKVPLEYANLTSLGESFLSVFILTTSEGWPGILKDFLDLGERYRLITIILCILVVAVLSVLVVNLFVGIIVDVLDQEQANLEYTGGVRSSTVLRWNEMQRAIFTSNLITEIVEHRGGDNRGGTKYNEGLDAREWLRRIITSAPFDVAVAVISFLSCLTMLVAGAWAETDVRWSYPSYQKWIFWINAIVVLAYVMEQCVRLVVFKMALFQKSIYILDLAVAGSSLIALLVGLTTSLHTAFPAEPLWPVAFRMIRVAYVVCNHLPVMRIISISLFNVVGSLCRVALFLFITIFFYGLFGTCLFYDARVETDQHFTFASLGESFLLLLSFSTGEVWHDTMLKIRAFYCAKDSAVLGWSILPYAISFVSVAFLLLMNLFTSTVLKGYVDAKRNQSLWKVAQQQQELLNKWRLREMKLSWLPIHVAVQVLAEIPPPIGFKDLYVELGTRRMQAILANLSAYPLPVYRNSVHIRDMVLTTTCRACEAHAQRRGPLASFEAVQSQQTVELNPRLVSAWISRFSDADVLTEFNILQYLAALQIQAFWRTQRLLQRKSVSDQLRYMKHLLFLLETSGPICSRKRSKNEGRRSTLRRKRGTKTGGSFIQKSAALAQLGTLKLDPERRDRLKGCLRRISCGVLSRHHGKRKTIPEVPVRIHRPSTNERLAQEEQQQRQNLLLHRSGISECITEQIDDGREAANEHHLHADKESFARHQGQEADPSRAEHTEETSRPCTGTAAIVAGTHLEPSTDSATAATPGRLSATSTTHIPLRAVTAVNSSAEEFHQVSEPKTTTAPRRSSMRAPQTFVPPQQPRRSLRIIPIAPQLQRASFSTVGHEEEIDHPRRRGQSVQFTGVEKVDLQLLLAPALAQRRSTDSQSDTDSDS